MAEAPCWCSNPGAGRSVELCEVWNDRKTKAYLSVRGGSKVGFSVACPSSMSQLKEKVVCGLERREREEGEISPTVFKLCLYVSPDCECATAFHNGGHCLFGGESVGILFQSFLEVLCLTRWGLSTSCGWRQACSLCPFLCLSSGVCPLCPLCRLLKALIHCMFTPVESCNDVGLTHAATFWITFVVGQTGGEGLKEVLCSAMLA